MRFIGLRGSRGLCYLGSEVKWMEVAKRRLHFVFLACFEHFGRTESCDDDTQEKENHRRA